MWHASVAMVSPALSQTLPLAILRAAEREELKARALELIGGVGREEIHVEVVPGGAAMHVKRRLSHEEEASLTPEWCAIAPFDASGGTLVETIPSPDGR